MNTKYGVVDTAHILFIAAGAFTISKPSDLIPELQGRFPLRVELESLVEGDFRRILLEPKNALIRQYTELLATEGVSLAFTDEAISRMSYLAAEVNSRMENIGARRLHVITSYSIHYTKLYDFLKVEATKYTEVGYVGRDSYNFV